MQVLSDILYFWLPALVAIFALIWAMMLMRRPQTRWTLAARLVVIALVLYLSAWSLWALYGTRFLNWWPTYLPYIFVGLALTITAICHVVLRRRAA
jgi:polyferredoxin